MNSGFLHSLIHRPVAVSMFYAALVTGGVFAFFQLPLELAPEKEYPRLSVTASWGNTSPETVEMFVTAPLEEIVNTIRGVKKVSSTSEEGRSVVTIEFEQATEMNFARLELNEKLAAFAETLPPGISRPQVERYVPKDMQNLQGFLSYSLSGDQAAYQLRKFGEESVVPVLLSIKGISDVQVLGGETREIVVEIDPGKILPLGLTIDQVRNLLGGISLTKPVGALNSQSRRAVLAVRNTVASVDELKSMKITERGSAVVRLRDIAIVRDTLGKARNFYRIDGKPTVTIVVNKEAYTNTLSLADAVFERLGEIQGRFPSGMRLLKQSDKSEQMRAELGKLYQEVIIALLFIFLVLLVFLRNIGAPLLILSSILFSLAGTFLMFWFLGIGLNLLTLAGLVLGFGRLVDDSIVVLENIHRHWRDSSDHSSDLITRSVSEVSLPVVSSTLTTVGALLPLVFLPQDLRPYFLDFSLAVSISLLMSLLVSFTLIPTASLRPWFRPRQGSSVSNSRVLQSYQSLLARCLRHKKTTIALTLWLFGIPVWLLPEKIENDGWPASAYNSIFGSELYQSIKPTVDHVLGGSSHLFFEKVTKGEVWGFGNQTYLIASAWFPQGTEIERYDQVARGIEREVLESMKSIGKVTTRVQGDYAVVRIDFDEAAALTAAPYELKNRLTLFAAQTGGASISVSGFGPGFYSGGESAPSFYVKVHGYNYNRVKGIAEEFRSRIERNPRIAEVDIDRSFGRWNKTFELAAIVDREAIARKGLTVAEIIRVIRAYTSGTAQYTSININQRQIPLSVKFEGFDRYDVEDLRNAFIVNRKGESARLGEVVDLEERQTPTTILRENQQYTRLITFEYKGPYRFGDQYINSTIQSMPLPNGYSFDRSFSFFMFSEKDTIAMVWIALAGLLIVFMITASLYESFVKPFVIILSIPFSLIGLFLIYYATDTPFGRGGYAAVMLLIGIVTTNSIVLVDFIARIPAKEATIEGLVNAACIRVRPILMTTLTTVGGMAPLLVMSDVTSIWYGMSLGTIGGLVTSMTLTLFVIPVVYAWFFRIREHEIHGSS